jgi:hypothetical protein
LEDDGLSYMSEVNLIWEQFQALYDDLDFNEHFPSAQPLLAHYTSIETLENIVRSDQLWFSNPLYMNDVDELRFGIREGAARFFNSKEIKESLSGIQLGLLYEYFNNHLNQFTNEHALDVYAFCLSQHDEITNPDGLLSMWRGYGSNGNGAAIVFDTAKLENLPSSSLLIGPVKYGSEQERTDWIDNKLKAFADLLVKLKLEDKHLYLAAYAIFERIKQFAIFTKHYGFSEEKEWRVVYFKERDKDAKLSSMLSYSIGGNGVEPKLKLKLESIEGHVQDGISLVNIVHQIILGPGISKPLAKAAFERMLEKIDKAELKSKVLASTIPFRY